LDKPLPVLVFEAEVVGVGLPCTAELPSFSGNKELVSGDIIRIIVPGVLIGQSGLRHRSDDAHIMHLESVPVKGISQHLEERRHRDCLAVHGPLD